MEHIVCAPFFWKSLGSQQFVAFHYGTHSRENQAKILAEAALKNLSL